MKSLKMFALFALATSALFAREVSPSEAETAVSAWLARNPRPLDERMASASEASAAAQTCTGDDGAALFHVVALKGGGYVVTSGDTDIDPVVAFSPDGSLSLDEDDNPVLSILRADMARRLEHARAAADRTASTGKSAIAGAKTKTANAASADASGSGTSAAGQAWAELLGGKTASKSLFGKSRLAAKAIDAGRESVSDVRVAPMTKAEWTQHQFGMGNPRHYYDTFNLYTPNNYPCGCVATAFLIVMRHWCEPRAAVAPVAYTCWISGLPTKLTLMGGTYDWANMPLTMDDCTDESQLEAMGKLAYDVSVAMQTDYGMASGAYSALGAKALTDCFGYAMARTHAFSNPAETTGRNIMDFTECRNAILASLDAKMPVIIGIFGSEIGGGHEAVVDGYGFIGDGKVYCHLNCGWAGGGNLWYDVMGSPIIEEYGFSIMADVVYNIHPHESGDIISGRVLDGSGAPVAGAKVSLSSGGRSIGSETTTDGKGIYALRFTGKGKYTVTARADGYAKATREVNVIADGSNTDCWLDEETHMLNMWADATGTVANRWGEDITLSPSSGGGDAQEEEESTSVTRMLYSAGEIAKEGDFDATAPAQYDGFIVDAEGSTIGSILLKTSKAGKTGEAKATATVLFAATSKKFAFKGVCDGKGLATLSCAGLPDLKLILLETSFAGTLGGSVVNGARNLFLSKNKAEATKANSDLARWIGPVNVAWEGKGGWNCLTVSVAPKGKVKVSGTLVDGTKVSASAQAIRGAEWCAVPVVVNKKLSLAFTLWLSSDGLFAAIDDRLGGSVPLAGRPGKLVDYAAFRMDASAFSAMIGDSTFSAQLPDGMEIVQQGAKWVLPKAGKVVLVKGTTEVDQSKALENPSALKLAYAAKTGAFKGNFKAYALSGGKPKATAVNVAGVMIDGIAYGTASIKKVGSLPVAVK